MPRLTSYKLLLNTPAIFYSLCISLSLSNIAYAQDSIFTIPAPQNESYADFGVAGVVRDTYVGSGQSETLLLPYFKAEYKGRVFFKPGLGAGVYAVKNKDFRLSVSGNLSLGRDTEDTPFRNLDLDKDLLEIDTTVTALIAGRYYLPFGAIDVLGSIPVGGDLNGQRIDALFTTEIKPFKNLRITPGVRTTYQSSGWVNSIYGLNDAQAEALGNDTFDINGQFATVGAHAVGYYQLPYNLELIGFINYSRLIGDVQDSPLVDSNNGLTAAIGFARHF
ncbi:MAG: MipA/OmpV family protein [Litorimonas sp.]